MASASAPSTRGQATAAMLKELMLDDDDDTDDTDDSDSTRSTPASGRVVHTAPPPPRDDGAALRVGQRTSIGRSSSPPARSADTIAATSLSPVPEFDGLETPPPRPPAATRNSKALESDSDDDDDVKRKPGRAAYATTASRAATAAADAASRRERHRRVQELHVSSSDEEDVAAKGRPSNAHVATQQRSAAIAAERAGEQDIHRSNVANVAPATQQAGSSAPSNINDTTAPREAPAQQPPSSSSSTLVVPPPPARPPSKATRPSSDAVRHSVAAPLATTPPPKPLTTSKRRDGAEAAAAVTTPTAAVATLQPPSYMSGAQLAAAVALRDDALVDRIEAANRAYRAATASDHGVRSSSVHELRAAAPPAPTAAASSSRGRSADDESPMFEVVDASDDDETEAAAEYVADRNLHLSTTPVRSAESSSVQFQLETQSNQQSGGGAREKSSGARERLSPALTHQGKRRYGGDSAAGGSSSSVDFYDVEEDDAAPAATHVGLGPRERSPLFYGGVRPAHDARVQQRRVGGGVSSQKLTKPELGKHHAAAVAAAPTAKPTVNSTSASAAGKSELSSANAPERRQLATQEKRSTNSNANATGTRNAASAATSKPSSTTRRVVAPAVRSRSVEDDTSQGTYTRLYVQAMNRRAYVLESREAERQRLETLALRDCTFAPVISAAAQKFGGLHRSHSAGSHLASVAERRSRRLQEERSVTIVEAEKSECTFAPSLEPVSVALVERIRERLAAEEVTDGQEGISVATAGAAPNQRRTRHSPSREAPLLLLPASERLYRDSRRRAIELEQQVEMQLHDLQRPAPKRTEAQMLEHVSQLQSFQQKREATIQRLLELENCRTRKPQRDVLFVDSHAVVERLLHRQTPDSIKSHVTGGPGGGAAAAMNVSADGASDISTASATKSTAERNTPRVPRVSHELAARKKQRVLERWFYILSSNSADATRSSPPRTNKGNSSSDGNVIVKSATIDFSGRGLRAAIAAASPALQHSDAFQAILKAAADYAAALPGQLALPPESAATSFVSFAAVLLRYEHKAGPQPYTSRTPEDCLRDAAARPKTVSGAHTGEAAVDAERVSARLYTAMTSSAEQKRRLRGASESGATTAAVAATPSPALLTKPTFLSFTSERTRGNDNSTDEVVSELLQAIAALSREGAEDHSSSPAGREEEQTTPQRTTTTMLARSGTVAAYCGHATTNLPLDDEASEVLMSPPQPPGATAPRANGASNGERQLQDAPLPSTSAPQLSALSYQENSSQSSSPPRGSSRTTHSRKAASEDRDDLLLQCAAGQRLSSLAIASREKRAVNGRRQTAQLRNLGKQMALAQLQARRTGLTTS